MIYLHKAINHGHTRFFEILQYIAEQSSAKRQSKVLMLLVPSPFKSQVLPFYCPELW